MNACNVICFCLICCDVYLLFCVGVQLVIGNVCINRFCFVVVLLYWFNLLFMFVCCEHLQRFVLWLNCICLCNLV